MKLKKQSLLLILIVTISLLFGCSKGDLNNKTYNQEKANTESQEKATHQTEAKVTSSPNGELKVHYINVGQADSILIQQGSNNMLIDAGNNIDVNTIVSYLKAQGVTTLNYVVMTHVHSDHVGSMDTVIKTFDIGTVYMPRTTSNTKTFEDVIDAMKVKNLKITAPEPGKSFNLVEAECKILAPNSDEYKDLNDTSIVLKVTFGENNFLFQGDAEGVSEKEILAKGFDVSADVLKLGHHGSSSSSTSSYLDKVFVDNSKPKYAIVSCGSNNVYNHPNKETMAKLKQRNIKVYRTDECGTIVMKSDGKNITCINKEGSYNSPQK